MVPSWVWGLHLASHLCSKWETGADFVSHMATASGCSFLAMSFEIIYKT